MMTKSALERRQKQSRRCQASTQQTHTLRSPNSRWINPLPRSCWRRLWNGSRTRRPAKYWKAHEALQRESASTALRSSGHSNLFVKLWDYCMCFILFLPTDLINTLLKLTWVLLYHQLHSIPHSLVALRFLWFRAQR